MKIFALVPVWMLLLACSSNESGTQTESDTKDQQSAELGREPDVAQDQSAPETVEDAAVQDTLEDELSVVPWVPGTPVEAQVFVGKADSGKVEGLAFDGAGGLYLTGSNGDVILAGSDGSVEVVGTVEKVDGFPTPNLAGAAYSPNWGLLLVQYSGSRMVQYTPENGTVVVRSDLDKAPNGILIGGDGAIYVTLSETGKVVRMQDPEAQLEVVAEGLSFPNGMAWDKVRNRLYVATTMPKGAVYTIDMTAALPAQPQLFSDDAALQAADGLVIAPDGHLLVAAFGAGKVLALDPQSGSVAGVVSEAPAAQMMGVASLAFGHGEGFDPYCVYATNMMVGGVLRICP